jgi:hypothetical protein
MLSVCPTHLGVVEEEPVAAKSNSQPVIFEKRTLVVWAALAASMTVVSGLLMLMGPQPQAPAAGPVLTVLDTSPAGVDSLFRTVPGIEKDRWQAIVIHHAGQPYGNAQSLGQQHMAQGYGGLSYHFVIGNGDGAGDGEIEVGFRWTRQLDGRHIFTADTSAWYNAHAIGICLIGNGDRTAPTKAQMEQLVRLVTALQRKLNIPASRVLLHSNVASTTSPGQLFPVASFRQQLVN